MTDRGNGALNERRAARVWRPWVAGYRAVFANLAREVDRLARTTSQAAMPDALRALDLRALVANPLLEAIHLASAGVWGPTYARTRRDTRRLALASIGKAMTKADAEEQFRAEWVELHLGWTMQEGARLVVEITAETQETIQQIVAEGLADGTWPPSTTAVEIKQHIGLHSRWQRAVDNYAAGLALQVGAGEMTQERAARLVAAYHEKLLRRRAQTIARTEAMDATNAAQMAAWQQDMAEGILPPTAMKVWEARDPCPICTDLALQDPIPMGEPFTSEYLGQPLMRPPAHPNCKCSVGKAPTKYFAEMFGGADPFIGRPPPNFRNPDGSPRSVSPRSQDWTGMGPPPLTDWAREAMEQRLQQRLARGGSRYQGRPSPVPTFG